MLKIELSWKIKLAFRQDFGQFSTFYVFGIFDPIFGVCSLCHLVGFLFVTARTDCNSLWLFVIGI